MESRIVGARDRFGGARIIAATLSAVGAGIATALHLRHAAGAPAFDPLEIYVGAMACAGWCGWRLLGMRLGDGPRRAALRGVTTALVAVAVFCVAAAGRQTAPNFGHLRFADVSGLFDHLLRRTLDLAAALADGPAPLAMLAAGMAAGLAAEALHRHWRWDRDAAIF